jgi:hypothetical protein
MHLPNRTSLPPTIPAMSRYDDDNDDKHDGQCEIEWLMSSLLSRINARDDDDQDAKRRDPVFSYKEMISTGHNSIALLCYR